MAKTFGETKSESIVAHDYIVENAAGRAALTGMTEGETIFQRDTGTSYLATGLTTSEPTVNEGTVLPEASSHKGLQFFKTDEDVLYRSNGTAWIALN